MSYRKSLEDLRQQLFAPEEPVEAPRKKYSGIIAAKIEPAQIQETNLPAYTDWLRNIQQVAETFQAEDNAGKAFAKGFSSTYEAPQKEVANPVESIPEERRESFVKKRGDKPSYYAPQESSSGEFTGSDGASAFLGAMDKHEGGGDYDTLFSHSQKEGGDFAGVKVSQMTLGELKQFTNGEYGSWSRKKLGYKATPMGRYQFVGTTMASVAKEMGLSDDTVFSPEVQDAMFEHLLRKTISRGKTVDEKIAHLRGTWEGFKNVDKSTLANLITRYGN